jgi:KDO2-lipid IV(A) lauroyltransferase
MIQARPDHWLWDKNRWQRILPDEDLPYPVVRGWKKRLGHYLGYRGTQLIYSLAQIIPLALLNPLGKILGKMAGGLAPSRRKIAEENLRIAFGKEKNESEIRSLSREFYRQAGQGAFRLLAYPRIQKQIEVEGEPHLREALKSGKGVILASGHVSVFPLILCALGKRNYPVHTFFRFPRDPRLGRYVLGHIKRMGGSYLRTHPPRLALERALECLAQNESILIFIDQNVHEGGEFIEFFGRPAATTTLPASLALRTQAPILPVFIKSNDLNNSSGFTVTIYPPLKTEPTGERKADRIRISRDLNQILEARIRENPAQWFWFHRRWKRTAEIELDVKSEK